METVKTGVNNPFALATIAAYGQHESGYQAKNVYGRWPDPSESGEEGESGGVMSLRDGEKSKRLTNMLNFVALNDGDINAPSPELQAQFLLAENPDLIKKLNAAKSIEEANQIMADAWRFAGYDQRDDPNGEYQSRLRTSQTVLGNLMNTIESASSSSDADFGPDTPPIAGLNRQLADQATGADLMTDLEQINVNLRGGKRMPLGAVADPRYEAAQFYKTDEAVQYFEQYPEDIEEAKADPLGFYNSKFAGGDRTALANRFAGDKPTPEQIADIENQEPLPPGQEEAVTTSDSEPDVPEAIKSVLKRPSNLVNFELERAKKRIENAKRLAEGEYGSLIGRRNHALHKAEVARRTGSATLREEALDTINDIDSQIRKLNAGIQTAHDAGVNDVVKLEAELAVRDLIASGDPRRIEKLWQYLGGTDVTVRQAAGGKFVVSYVGEDGKRVSTLTTKNEIASSFWADISSDYRNTTAATAASRAGAEFESMIKRIEKQAEQVGASKAELLLESLKQQGMDARGDPQTGTVIWSTNGDLFEYNPNPGTNANGVAMKKLTVSRIPRVGQAGLRTPNG